VKPRSPVVVLMLVLSVLCLALAILQAISPFVPHAFSGVGFESSGYVYNVFPSELSRGTRVVVGDSVMERPNGDVLRGYRLRVLTVGDTIHVATAHGTVVARAAPYRYERADALPTLIRSATLATVILFAAVLFVRKPGVMSFAFWLWAVSGLSNSDLDYAIDWLPRAVGLTVSLLFVGLSYSGLALVSFALRFPSGDVPARWRWLDRTAWAALGCSAVAEVVESALYFPAVRRRIRTVMWIRHSCRCRSWGRPEFCYGDSSARNRWNVRGLLGPAWPSLGRLSCKPSRSCCFPTGSGSSIGRN
jgi:hypothetical protein